MVCMFINHEPVATRRRGSPPPTGVLRWPQTTIRPAVWPCIRTTQHSARALSRRRHRFVAPSKNSPRQSDYRHFPTKNTHGSIRNCHCSCCCQVKSIKTNELKNLVNKTVPYRAVSAAFRFVRRLRDDLRSVIAQQFLLQGLSGWFHPFINIHWNTKRWLNGERKTRK